MEISEYQSPVGTLQLAFSEGVLVNLSFQKQDSDKWLSRHYPQETLHTTVRPERYAADLDRYFRGEAIDFDWPITLIGTPFQKRVWNELLKIPRGKTTTYKAIASACDCNSPRAVGQAVGANPISIVVPCHRVLGTHNFGGFAGGLNTKRLLLEIEGALSPPHDHA